MDVKTLRELRTSVLKELYSKKTVLHSNTYNALVKEFKQLPYINDFKKNQNPNNLRNQRKLKVNHAQTNKLFDKIKQLTPQVNTLQKVKDEKKDIKTNKLKMNQTFLLYRHSILRLYFCD
jgi:hypothetical protein